MPIAHISWNPPRRSRHWSNRATAKTRARIESARGGRLPGSWPSTFPGTSRSAGGGAGRAARRRARTGTRAGPNRAPAAGPGRSTRRGRAAAPRRTARPPRSGSCPRRRAGGQARRRGPSPRLPTVHARPGHRLRHRGGRRGPDQLPSVVPVAFAVDVVAGRRARRGVIRVASLVGACQSLRAGTHAGQPALPGRRVATSASIVRRSKRRCPPGVTYASMRPSSAQRRRVSGSTPTMRLAGPRDSQRGAATATSDTRRPRGKGADESASVGGYAQSDSSTWGSVRCKPGQFSVSTVNTRRARIGSPPDLCQTIPGSVANGRPDRAGRSGRRSGPVRRGRTRGRRGGSRRTGPSAGGVRRDADRAHDLADLAALAEQEALAGDPVPDAGRVAVELERAGIDRRSLGPVDGRLGGHDVEEVDPPGRSGMTCRQPSQRAPRCP